MSTILSCSKEKTINDFSDNDFYKIQGIVYESKENTRLFGESTWDIKYVFKIKEESFKGVEKDFSISMLIGQAVIILVHKENPEINFFKEIGVLAE